MVKLSARTKMLKRKEGMEIGFGSRMLKSLKIGYSFDKF
jgi:hypothetical protein